MAGTDALDALRTIPLFSHVADGDLEQIASHLIERRYPRNTTIVEEGLPGDYMYIIREGRVKVTKLSEDGREKILAFFEVGHFVGDMALLDRAPRSASVKALTPVRVLALSRADFTGLIRKSPDLAIAVIRELSGRKRSAQRGGVLGAERSQQGRPSPTAPARRETGAYSMSPAPASAATRYRLPS